MRNYYCREKAKYSWESIFIQSGNISECHKFCFCYKREKKRLFTNKCYSLSISRDKYKSVGGVSTIIRGEFEEVFDLAKQSAQSVSLPKGVVDHNIPISAYQMSNTLDLIRKAMMWSRDTQFLINVTTCKESEKQTIFLKPFS
jgi:hypothetical protein